MRSSAIERELAPIKSKHWDSILMDAALFDRIDCLYRMRDQLALSAEAQRVLERYHTKFNRAGAALDAAAKARLADINERLATLGTTFQARTCWRTSRVMRWCSTVKTTSPVFRIRARGGAGGGRGA